MAKRVNKKFLIILTCCVMGPVLALFFATVFLKSKNAVQVIAAGDAHYEKGEYDQALTDYIKAYSLSPSTALLIRQGDCQSELCRTEPERLGKFRVPWEKALEFEPSNVEALKRLYESTRELAELSPAGWDQLRNYAEKYLKADPSKKSVEVMMRVAEVNAWLRGGKALQDQEKITRLQTLEKLMEANPSEKIIPQTIAAARIRMARDNQTSKNTTQLEENCAKAKEIVDKAAEAQPQNAEILYIQSMTYIQLASMDSDAERAKGLLAAAYDILKAANDILKNSPEMATRDPEDYVDIRLSWSQKLITDDKFKDAETVLRELVEQCPTSSDAVISLAKFLRVDPKTRPEAINLLSRKLPDDDRLKGFQVQRRIYGDLERLSLLTMIQIDSWASTETADKPALRQLINDNISRLRKMGKNNPLVLKAEGCATLMDADSKEYITAIRTLEEAVTQMDALKAYDADLYYRLAQAYLRVPDSGARQTGQAERLLRRILEVQPQDTLARQLLIKVLNDERKFDLALRQIDFFVDNKIDAPGLAQDRIIALTGAGKQDKARELVNTLPESTFAERLSKAKLASLTKMTVLADNLMRRLNQEEMTNGSKDKDYAGTYLLVMTLVRDRKREEANTVAQTALQKDPRNHRLNLIVKLLEGENDPEKLTQFMSGVGDGGDTETQDEDTAIQKAVLYANQGEVEKALSTVVLAEKSLPDNLRLLAAIFGYQLELKKYEDAELTLKKLQKFNADQADGITYRIQLKLARQDFDGAIKDATELTTKQETFAASWVLKGMAQQGVARKQRLEVERTKNYEAAIVSFNKALDCQADNFPALRGLIDCHLAIGQEPIAREVIRKGMQGERAAYFIEQNRRLEELRGDPRKVTAEREKAVQENPANTTPRMALIDNYSAVASFLRGKNDQAGYDAAVARMNKSLEEAVKQWPQELAFASRLAQSLASQKKFDQAISVLTALAETDAWKGKPQPMTLLAQYALASGNRSRAEEYYIQAAKLAGDAVVYQQQLVNFYLQNDMKSKGLDLLKTMVDRSQSVEMRTRYVSLLIANKQIDKAEEICRQTMAKDPSDLDARCLMAFIRMNSGANSEAERLLEEALKINPRHPRALYYRGVLKFQKNDITGAVADLTSARVISPENPDIRITLADVLLQRGENNSAANELEDAIRYVPNRSDARMKLVSLYFSLQRWDDLNRVLEDGIRLGEAEDVPLWLKFMTKMWIARNNLKNAMDAIEAASELAPNDPEVNYYFLDICLRNKQYAQVVDVTDKVIRDSQVKPWWMYMQRGLALSALKREADAKAAFEMSMGQIDLLNSSDAAEQLTREMADAMGLPWVHEQLAMRKARYWMLCDMRQYIASGDVDSGLRIADRFTDESMTDLSDEMKIKTRIYIGETFTLAASGGDERAFKRAVEIYNAVLKDSDRTPTLIRLQVLNNLAFLYSDGSQKDYAKGLVYSQQAYDLMTKMNYINPTIADTHAWLLILNNQFPRGIALLQSVLEQDSSFPDVHYHLAEAYYRNKQYPSAKDEIEKASDALAKIIVSEKAVDASLENKIKDAKSRIELALQSNNPGNPG